MIRIRARFRLATEDDARFDQASRHSITPGCADRLAADPLPQVRNALATNPTLPPSAQRILAGHPDASTRRLLASNAVITEEVQSLLAADPEVRVRRVLAANPNLTEEVQHLLLGDTSVAVRLRMLTSSVLVVRDDTPVALLAEHPQLESLLDAHLVTGDAQLRAALVPTWAGTLGQLRAALVSFAPEELS